VKEESSVRKFLVLPFVAAIVATFVISPAAHASINPQNVVGPYRFQNKLGMVLAVNGGHMSNGNKVIQWSDTGSLDQQWYADYVDPFHFRIKNRKTSSGSSFCLDVPNGSTADGVNLQIWKCGSNPWQIWYWGSDDNHTGYSHLYNYSTGQVLAVNGGDATPGRDIIQWYWQDVPDQNWGAAHL
jgi:Ricin-type beta-trefoil lectin domain-like